MNYPMFLPVGDIAEIVRILKAGAFVAERTTLAKHIWVVQGYAQYATFGEPGDLLPQALLVNYNYQVGNTLPELTAALEGILQRETGEPTAQALAIPVAWLLRLILPKLLDLLFEYLRTKI